ncbi:sugar-binding transcriptional regulator [Sporolactobacillus laevolacticus]|uniref:Central glycolytic genes regulator n=1 Tax=Sporolactobacillus laevolacticus DSM 442 TaxID=1395513 RepID=V6IXY8_9BACL|nr:sugar-binding domain-containing protein [Sporolactobacillus laevolacticus]EST11576.1 central glycolytic genes regulator [Sporolactobacillus laevolacticus DSM 442]MDN3956489.1 sugar-binding domain-containing protein [Sporolactobacillus laevolacticus]
MEHLLDLQKRLIPDVLDIMSSRYRILQSLHFLQPIGRRSLSSHLGMTERVLRGEVTFLSQQGLIQMASSGMYLTENGEAIVKALGTVMKNISGLKNMEKQLEEVLGVSKVVIVSGDSDQYATVKNEMGLACVKEIERALGENNIIAVTGGSTLAAVAEMMRPLRKAHQDLLFVSARGGLGEKVENQANTICAKMAEKAEGRYHLLHVPDQLSDESYHSLMEEPSIHRVMQHIRRATIIVHGIGDAKTMAVRRHSGEEFLRRVDTEHAVAEAFGYFFDQTGRVIHKVQTIGLQWEDLFGARSVIAVAGGKSKAEAIQAYFKKGPDSVLITDEGAAQKILKNFQTI